MNFTAFRASGNWYKGNLHSHTVNSDGKLTPEQSVQLFKKNGYSFLCLTEHDLYTDYRSEFNTDTFIILPGIEASAYLLDPHSPGTALQVHHMNGILGPSEMQAAASAGILSHKTHLEPVVRYGTWNALCEAAELSAMLRSHGCIVMYNHPVWSRTVPEDFMDAGGLWALEIYNYDTENECAQGYDTRDWDIMLQKNRRCYAAATDDNHNPAGFDDACGGFVFVQADTLTHDDILHSLLEGRF